MHGAQRHLLLGEVTWPHRLGCHPSHQRQVGEEALEIIVARGVVGELPQVFQARGRVGVGRRCVFAVVLIEHRQDPRRHVAPCALEPLQQPRQALHGGFGRPGQLAS